MTEKKQLRCASCRDPIETRPSNKHFPFCSQRCRMVDLGRWLNEEYRMPIDNTSTERSIPRELSEESG